MANTSAVPRFHDYAESFSLAEGKQFESLVKSVKDSGLKYPIIRRHDGVYVDGRNRWRACIEAGIEPRFEVRELTEEETIDLIAISNIERRHMNESERAMASEDYVERKVECRKIITGKSAGNSVVEKDGPGKPSDGIEQATKEAAEKFNNSVRQIRKARAVKRANPELAEKARRGEISLNKADRIIKGKDVENKPKEKSKKKQDPQPAPEVPAVKDGLGNSVPKELHATFNSSSEFDEIRNEINSMIRRVEKLAASPGGEYVHVQSIRSDLNNAKRGVAQYKPFAVCTHCRGKGCEKCRNVGWFYKQAFENIPKE